MHDPVWFHFSAAWKRIGANSNPRKAYARLVMRYERPARFYHTLNGHILHCLEELTAAQPFTGHSDRAVLAILYHDAYNDPHKGGDELRSAKLLSRELVKAGVSAAFINETLPCVLVTQHLYAPAWIDGKAVMDADLSILGQGEDAFDRYTDQIRQEYVHVPWSVYRVKRAEILARFLTYYRVYHTPYFRERYEVQARKNITRALRFLEQ